MKTVDFVDVEAVLEEVVPAVTPALQLVVHRRGQHCFTRALGWLDPEQQTHPTQLTSRFDLASVTKLFVTAAFMRLVEQHAVALDQPIADIFPEFRGERPIQPYEDPLQTGNLVTIERAGGTVNGAAVTFRHLLTHTAGLPAWRPLFRQADATAARQMARGTFFSAPIGKQVVYSDIGLILLGMAVEKLTAQALDEAVSALVLTPLGLSNTGYLPIGGVPCDPTTLAPTEQCAWRQRRVLGEVHDENAARLGGVSGHAGLFSTAGDVARFGQMFLDDGRPLLQATTVQEMRRRQTMDGETARGLGFLLWSPEPMASSHPFSRSVFGHTGFTGTSLWIDPERELVVALLTNEVYYGRQNRRIAQLRVDIHQAIVAAVDQLGA